MPNTYQCEKCGLRFGAWIPRGTSRIKGCPNCGSQDFELISTFDPVPPGMPWAKVEKIEANKEGGNK